MLKGLFTGLIVIYQKAISPYLLHSCRFTPSCSQYTLEAITKYGIIKGCYLGGRRILKCHPWGGKGFDPVP